MTTQNRQKWNAKKINTHTHPHTQSHTRQILRILNNTIRFEQINCYNYMYIQVCKLKMETISWSSFFTILRSGLWIGEELGADDPYYYRP